MFFVALQDKLDHALQNRPKPEELVKDGILQGLQIGQGDLPRTDIADRERSSRCGLKGILDLSCEGSMLVYYYWTCFGLDEDGQRRRRTKDPQFKCNSIVHSDEMNRICVQSTPTALPPLPHLLSHFPGCPASASTASPASLA